MKNRPLVVFGCLVLCGTILLLAYPVVRAAMTPSNDSKSSMCMSNLKQVGKAMSMYEGDHDRKMCPGNWVDCLHPYEKRWDVLACPSFPHPSGKPSRFGYAMNTALVGASSALFHPDTVLIFEADSPSVNLVGNPNIRSGRHQGQSNVLFASLTVKRRPPNETLRSSP